MRRSRLIPAATFVTLVLTVLAVGHEATYVAAHGLGQGYDEAMAEGGHLAYWGAFMATAFAAVAALLAAAITQYRRLRRLSARVRAGAVVRDGGSRPLLFAVARLWPRLMVASSLAFLGQENIERMGAGPAPGLGVLAGDHGVALPVLLLTSLAVSIVAAIYRWRRDILLAIVRSHPRWSARGLAPAPRPSGTWTSTASSEDTRLHGLRAPPFGGMTSI